jgi:hypothetical protein
VDFDWGEIGKIFGYLIPVILFLVFNVLLKKQQEQKRRVTAVKSLVLEIEHNQKLMESFSMEWKIKKFKTTTWEKNKDKMDYLEDKGLYSTLIDTYEITNEFNREMVMAKEYGSTSYLAGIKLDRLRDPLLRSINGLQEWLELNKNKKSVSAPTS